MILIGTLLYFGALFIPAVYLMATRWRGAAKRPDDRYPSITAFADALIEAARGDGGAI